MFTKKFKEFVKSGMDNYYIGLGNPNAPILIIGQEPKIVEHDLEGLQNHSKNAKEWMENIENNIPQINSYPVDKNHAFRTEKSWGSNTWSKYQKLNNLIFQREGKPYYIDFLEDVFTTEMNESPAENNVISDKSSIPNRKRLLQDSPFIQNFPVVILACSHYIQNIPENPEINTIFGVTYDGDKCGKHEFSRGNWLYTHHNEDRSKLVIHTRQLSNSVSPKLLEGIADKVREHLNKIKN